MKHTTHSRYRTSERTDAPPFWITEKIRKRQFVGLPRQTLNKRVALVEWQKGDYREGLVVIYAKSTGRIITVLKLEQYMKSHGHTLNEDIKNFINERYLTKSQQGDNSNVNFHS